MTALTERLSFASGTAWRQFHNHTTARLVVFAAEIAVVALVLALMMRPDVELSIAARAPVDFSSAADGTITNAFELTLNNRTATPQSFIITADGIAGVKLQLAGGSAKVMLAAGEMRQVQAWVTAPADVLRVVGEFWPIRIIAVSDAGKGSVQKAEFRRP